MVDLCPVFKDTREGELIQALVSELIEIKRLILDLQMPHASAIRDASKSPMREQRLTVHPLRQRAVSVCTEIDWLFKKAGNGGYDYRTANESAYRFLVRLKQHGNAQAKLDEFLEWLNNEARPLTNSLRVTPSMFDFLENLFTEHRPRMQA